MEYFRCEDKENCGMIYFTDAFEGFKCMYCKSNIVRMTDEEYVEHVAYRTAWAADHPTVSC